ncbi:hypothetical protein E3N88_20091 [Mikania micrantha]|uniref:ATP-dependent DNA helicase n=1 Tax=Mikania micrantha TaxID=192012 RepID=A0A5N6NIU3_9ASTR|nr:hypothetical protein E3N88_20091 [Mikania micrantha]
MNDRRCFESLDKSLRDLLNNPNKPFGGRSVLLGGDFRETLPIKREASKTEILASSLPRSHLWKHFKVYMLTENMRLHRPNMNLTERHEVEAFSSWLFAIGDGILFLVLYCFQVAESTRGRYLVAYCRLDFTLKVGIKSKETW